MPVGKHAKATSLPLECPLHSAARHHPSVAAPFIRLLITAAADPNRADQFRQTPLHVAAGWTPLINGPLTVGQSIAVAVLELLRAGAVADASDSSGRTALMLASSDEIRDQIRAVLEIEKH